VLIGSMFMAATTFHSQLRPVNGLPPFSFSAASFVTYCCHPPTSHLAPHHFKRTFSSPDHPSDTSAVQLEISHTLQTRNLVRILGHHVRHHGILSLWHLFRNVHRVGYLHVALLQRTLKIDVGDLIAQVCRLVDQGDEAVLDRQGHFGAGFDVFAEDAGRTDV
jgi:hypothetical protein